MNNQSQPSFTQHPERGLAWHTGHWSCISLLSMIPKLDAYPVSVTKVFISHLSPDHLMTHCDAIRNNFESSTHGTHRLCAEGAAEAASESTQFFFPLSSRFKILYVQIFEMELEKIHARAGARGTLSRRWPCDCGQCYDIHGHGHGHGLFILATRCRKCLFHTVTVTVTGPRSRGIYFHCPLASLSLNFESLLSCGCLCT
jgi:hypothetical protein